MFLSRVALDDVMLAPHEYFDEMFVTGWEDSDLYFRLGLRGWRTVVDPQVVTWHARSLSSGGRDSFREIDSEYQYRIIRNRYYSIVKNLPLALLARLAPTLIAVEVALPFYLLSISPNLLLKWLQAYKDLWQNRHILLNRRTLIQSGRRASLSEVVSWFKPTRSVAIDSLRAAHGRWDGRI